MRDDKITAMWEEDGDLMRLKGFFAYIHQDNHLKDRIKKKTLEKITAVDNHEMQRGIDLLEINHKDNQLDKENNRVKPEKNTEITGISQTSRNPTRSNGRIPRWKRVKDQLMNKTVIKTLSAAAVVVFAVYLGSTGLLTDGLSPFKIGSLKSADMVKSDGRTEMNQAQAPTAPPQPSLGIKGESMTQASGYETEEYKLFSRENGALADVSAVDPTSMDQKIIYVFEVSIKSDNVASAMEAVEEKVSALGGYVAESRQNSYENKTTAFLSLRIPVTQFENFKGEVAQFGVVSDEHLFTDDVSTQYFDVETRLRSWEAQEKRYLEILQQAKSVEDILRIEDSLSNVRREMESLKGQLKYWDNRVQYSEVRMNIYPSQSNYNVNDPWQPVSIQSTFQAAKNAVVKSISMLWNGINYILIFIGYALPVVILAFGAWFIYRQYKKRR